MALVVADRVQETTTTSGTGTLSLGGAVPGYSTFVSRIGSGNTTYYAIYDYIAGVWEVGIGTVTSGSPNTLSRTTVLSNSSGTTSPLTLAGNSSLVFCTYPSEKSVNLDASGNVTALGTVSSGTWQATTVAVAYGGTGVTASSGANSVVLRDANQNITANNTFNSFTSTTAAAGTTTLTAASSYYQKLLASGSNGQTFKLPDATTLPNGATFIFDNDSNGTLTIQDSAGGAIDTVASGGIDWIYLEANGTSAGSWGQYALLPASYDFTASTASFGSATITNAVWNGTTIAYNYGGTGLTTFSAANNALYSTSATTLTAGTLPPAAGGTGVTTTPTNGQLLVGNGTNYTVATLGTGTGISTTTGAGTLTINNTGVTSAVAGTGISVSGATGAVTITNTGVTSFSAGTTGLTPNISTTGSITLAGTLAIANGGTGQTTASAAFNALSPITTTGDLIVGNGTNSATRLGIGTSGYALVSNGTTVTYSQVSLTAGVTGTLPIANGGTNSTATPTAGGVGYGTGTAHAYSSAGTSGQALLSGGASAPTFGTLGVGAGGTGQTTASSAFNALSPITTTGDLIIGNGTNSATRLAIGTNGYLLTSNGTTASWQPAPATGVTKAQAIAYAMTLGF